MDYDVANQNSEQTEINPEADGPGDGNSDLTHVVAAAQGGVRTDLGARIDTPMEEALRAGIRADVRISDQTVQTGPESPYSASLPIRLLKRGVSQLA